MSIKCYVDMPERKRSVLRWLKRNGVSEFSVRKVHHALSNRQWALTVAAVREVLEALEIDGFIRFTEFRQGTGGRPSEVYAVVPGTLR